MRLATPVVVSQAAAMMVSVADTLMVGKLGDAPLAAVAFSTSLSVPVGFFGIGVTAAITPFVSRRYGRGDKDAISHIVRHARRMNTALAVVMVVILVLLNYMMPMMGQPEEVCEIAMMYLPLLTASIFAQQMFFCSKSIAEGLQDTRTPMMISVSANILNIIGNYVLIFGAGPIEAMGVYGAAMSTLVSRWLMWIAMEVVLRRRLLKMEIYSKTWERRRMSWFLFRCGLPVGMQSVLECGGFAFGAIMMGWFGAAAAAAHQVVNLFTSLTYLMCGGIGTAVTIKVALSIGENNCEVARRYAKAGLVMAAGFMSFTTVLLICLRNYLPGLIIDSEEAIAIGASLMLVGGVFEIFDGVQITAIGALRGYADLRYPAVAAGLAFLLVGIPVGYIVAFPMGVGPAGIWWGYVSGLLTASVLLLVRLRGIMRRFER